MKRFFQEFREFALRGNVMSLAVGMLIGMAFQAVVTSLTDNIISPLIGLLIGQNFDALTWNVMGVTLGYGAFITAVLNFIIMAFVAFLIVRTMNRLQSAKEQEVEASQRHCPFCQTQLHPEAVRCPACTSEIVQ